ncbi:MAG: YHYH protein [Bacteroidota bacterium]
MKSLIQFITVLVMLYTLSSCSSNSDDVDPGDGNTSVVSDLVINVSSSAAMASWLRSGNESSWTVEYGIQGFTQGQGNSSNEASSLGNFGVSRISGLAPSTNYDIYITVPGSFESLKDSFTTTADGTSVFTINTNATSCDVDIQNDLSVSALYSETVAGGMRTIMINDIPNHLTGEFPTPSTRRIGNPNTIAEQNISTYNMSTTPTQAANTTSTRGWVGGVLTSGVALEVFTAESFTGFTGVTNQMWNRTTLQTIDDLGLDCNNAHVQPGGQYHYHGLPNALGEELGINGTAMVKVGYAADGYPIYYSYIDDGTGTIKKATASYQLIDGDRGGDGITAPSGAYDGEYFQDYEYVVNSGDLDACNGRTGPTPEAPSGEYYYVITETFPSLPICFSGTPDSSFQLMGG